MTRQQNSLVVLLRITAFRRMWLALSTSSLGDWLGLLATTALAAYLTKDASSLAQGAAVSGVLVTRLLPDLVLGPIAGALVDRLDRRYVAIVGDSLAGLLYLSIPLMGNLTWLLIAQFLVEAIGLFSNPAKQALWVNIVPRERLAVANQLNYVSVYGMVPVAALVFALLATAAQFFGALPVPQSGTTGALISVTSAAAVNIALVIDAATYFVAASVLFVTRHQIPAYVGEREPAKSVFSLVREGVGYVKNSAVMRAIYVGILGAFAAGGLVAGVAQAYVATMGGGNAGYGILFGTVFSGIAVGMLIGPKVLPAVPRRMVFTLGIGVAGVALVAMSLIQDFVGAAIMSVVMGLFAGIAWITGFTMIGHEVADRLRGRVFAFVMSSVRVILLGTIAAGPILASTIGAHPVTIGAYRVVFSGPGVVLAVSGLLTVGVAIFAGRQVGGLRGEFLKQLWHRLIRGRRREFLDEGSSMPGVFVTLVGPEPAATERVAAAVSAHLSGRGFRVQSESLPAEPWQPGDSEPGALRELAQLSEVVTQRFRPALEDGSIVVCRDFLDPLVVRFGAQAGLGEERMIRMADWATGGLQPDVTILVDPDRGLAGTHDDIPGGGTSPESPSETGNSDDAAGAEDSAGAGAAGAGAAGAGAAGAEAGGAGPAGRAPADDLLAGDVMSADALGPGASDPDSRPPAAQGYRTLAASAPGRYVTVAPLADGEDVPDDLADHLNTVMKTRSPVQVELAENSAAPAVSAPAADSAAADSAPAEADRHRDRDRGDSGDHDDDGDHALTGGDGALR